MPDARNQTLIQETQTLWQERYSGLLSQEDAKQILSNVGNFFKLLDEWDRRSDIARNEKPAVK